MIQVRDLRVDYDDVCAVRDLSLEIPPGEIFGLIGPNGAGKTTTLRALMGLLEPTYGEILLNGVNLETHREQAIGVVGFMPDFSPVYEELTVWEYLDLFAASYFIPQQQRAATIDKYLALVDLTEKRNAMTAGLSRGMKQRLLLAKTLLPEPKVVLLDEPASGMDPFGRALLRNILQQLGAEGKAIIISSHILVELSEFCTSIGIMEKGRMVMSGRVADIAAQVMGKAAMWAEVINGAEICHNLLASNELVSDILLEGDFFTFAFAGNQAEAGELLANLIAQGVRIASYGRKKDDLEELFLRVGAKEVS